MNGLTARLCYLNILFWARSLLQKNPRIMPCFADFVGTVCPADPLPQGHEKYEAAVVERLLLGLVELRPPGVTCRGRPRTPDVI